MVTIIPYIVSYSSDQHIVSVVATLNEAVHATSCTLMIWLFNITNVYILLCKNDNIELMMHIIVYYTDIIYWEYNVTTN